MIKVPFPGGIAVVEKSTQRIPDHRHSAAASGEGLSLRRQPQYDVAVTLARAAQGAEAVDHTRLQPDQALALLVDLVFEADTAERKRFGGRVECRLGSRSGPATLPCCPGVAPLP